MILTCPECKSRYVVNPSALLPHGRTVRCAKCKHNWFESKPEDDIEVIPEQKVDDPVDEAPISAPDNQDSVSKYKSGDEAQKDKSADREGGDFDFPISQPRIRKRPVAKGSNLPALQNQKYGSSKMGWVSLVIFITALVSLFLIFQDFISTSWPASKRLYAAAGLNQVQTLNTPDEVKEIPLEERLKIGPLALSRANINNVDSLIIKGHIENISEEQQTLPKLRITLLDDRKQAIRDWTFTAQKSEAAPNEQVTFETSLPNPPSAARDVSVVFATK